MTLPAGTQNSDAGTSEPARLRALVEDYLAALGGHQLEKCLSYFADDATIEFQSGVFKGPEAIAEWHRDRFAAGFQIVDIEGVTVEGSTVIVEASIASGRLRTWKINKLSGRATVRVENGQIKEARLAPKMYNPFEGWSAD
jgi:ketosteroid isomerase-like protein